MPMHTQRIPGFAALVPQGAPVHVIERFRQIPIPFNVADARVSNILSDHVSSDGVRGVLARHHVRFCFAAAQLANQFLNQGPPGSGLSSIQRPVPHGRPETPEAFGICGGQVMWTSHTCHVKPMASSSLSFNRSKCFGCHPSTAVVRFLKFFAACLISFALRASGICAPVNSMPWRHLPTVPATCPLDSSAAQH
jgi:hypothetical protein